MNKKNIFKPLIEQFETQRYKDYCYDMVEHIPDYFFVMPSSTSGKYHNVTQCQEYGQIYHTYMFASILNHLLRLEHNQEKYDTPELRDSMRCIPIFHDAIKCGWNGSTYTVQNHPLLAKEWVLSTIVEHDIPKENKQIIANACEAHSGQWNTDRKGNEIMSKPRNDLEFLIHECDILSSRADLDWIISNDLKVVLDDAPHTAPEDFVMPFGKYVGLKLGEIYSEDPQYIEWAKENIEKEPLRSKLKELEV